MATALESEHTVGAFAPLRSKIKDAVVAVSLAHLCLISAWSSMLYDADKGYYNKLRVEAPSLLALLVNILGFGFLLWLLQRIFHLFKSVTGQLAGAFVLCCLMLVPADFCRIHVAHLTAYQVMSAFRNPSAVVCFAALLAWVAWKPRAVARLPAAFLTIVSPLALFNLTKIILLLIGVVHLTQHTGEPKLASLVPFIETAPRVIWIIFDETDQRLAFEQRPAGLALPELDRLRREAIVATNAYPPADCTFLSMPALISGQLVRDAKIETSSDLNLTLESGQNALWSHLPSLFDSAHEAGINSALVGWYHPYGRVLCRGLNYCSWYAVPLYESARAPTFSSALIREVATMRGALHRKSAYIQTCRSALNDGLVLATNRSYGLVALHLPPPHTPGIYDPDRNRYALFGMPPGYGYFNNLVLVDRWLAAFRGELESAGLWDSTWLIISADHSWRQSYLYDGRRDLRVPFLARTPGVNRAMTYSPYMNTVLTYDLILAILHREVANQQDVVAWLDKHHSTHKPQEEVPPEQRPDPAD